MKRPQLGSWHTITERAKKVRDGNQVHWQVAEIKDGDYRRGELVFCGEGETPPKKEWSGKDWRWRAAPPITSYHAMYIGFRHKRNGKHEEWQPYSGEGWMEIRFIQSEAVEVWMFVTHENRKPIPVFPFEWEQK